jgi:hypothetical protein
MCGSTTGVGVGEGTTDLSVGATTEVLEQATITKADSAASGARKGRPNTGLAYSPLTGTLPEVAMTWMTLAPVGATGTAAAGTQRTRDRQALVCATQTLASP